MKVLLQEQTLKLRQVTMTDLGADHRPGERFVVMAAGARHTTARYYSRRLDATEAFYALVTRDNNVVSRAAFHRHQDGITRGLRAHIEAC